MDNRKANNKYKRQPRQQIFFKKKGDEREKDQDE